MRQLGFITCIFICALASGQSRPETRASIYADIPSIIMNNRMVLGFSHSFSTRWSAEGSLGLNIIKSGPADTKEIEHESMLGLKNDRKNGRTEESNFMIGLKYWPHKYYEGAYLGVHCSYNIKKQTDIAVDCGYAIKAFKHLGIVVGYRIMLMECMNSNIFNTEGITIGINYIF